jgi:hypothetical protein
MPFDKNNDKNVRRCRTHNGRHHGHHRLVDSIWPCLVCESECRERTRKARDHRDCPHERHFTSAEPANIVAGPDPVSDKPEPSEGQLIEPPSVSYGYLRGFEVKFAYVKSPGGSVALTPYFSPIVTQESEGDFLLCNGEA